MNISRQYVDFIRRICEWQSSANPPNQVNYLLSTQTGTRAHSTAGRGLSAAPAQIPCKRRQYDHCISFDSMKQSSTRKIARTTVRMCVRFGRHRSTTTVNSKPTNQKRAEFCALCGLIGGQTKRTKRIVSFCKQHRFVGEERRSIPSHLLRLGMRLCVHTWTLVYSC